MGFTAISKDNTIIFSIPSFSASGLVEHGFTSRLGGYSTGAFQSLNLGFHVGDDVQKVWENRKKVAEMFGVDLTQLVAGYQVHGNKVHIVSKKDAGRGSTSLLSAISETDALVTNEPGILLSTYYADCVPLFFLDKFHKVVGLAHAGWKGTQKKIGIKTIETMSKFFHSRPEQCLVGIGPSIGPCCYRVDHTVISQFKQEFAYYHLFSQEVSQDQWVLDLWKANQEQLVRAGVPRENITMSNLCTACHHDVFYSSRKENGHTGRQASLIMLREGSI